MPTAGEENRILTNGCEILLFSTPGGGGAVLSRHGQGSTMIVSAVSASARAKSKSRREIAPIALHLHHVALRSFDSLTTSSRPTTTTSIRIPASTATRLSTSSQLFSGCHDRYFWRSDPVPCYNSPTVNAFALPAQSTAPYDSTMPSRKRSHREAESAHSEQPKEQSLIQNLRNSFYFANLYQWICIFGKVVKLDDNLDIAVCSRSQTALETCRRHYF